MAVYETGVRRLMEMAGRASLPMAILTARSPACGGKEMDDGTFTGKLTFAGDFWQGCRRGEVFR